MAAHSPRLALSFIFITVLLDSIGFGVIMPVMPQLLMVVTGESLSQAAIYGGWLMFLYALMQFFFAPIMGNLSDRFGRRPVLLLSLLAFGLNYLLMGWAPTLTWLIVGRLISGSASSRPSSRTQSSRSRPAKAAARVDLRRRLEILF